MARILHLSDLHLKTVHQRNSEAIRAALFSDVATAVADQPVDCVVFTGDLAFSGAPEEYRIAEQELLRPLCDAAKLPRERILIAPGNHDIDRNRVSRFDEAAFAEMIRQGRDQLDAVLREPGRISSSTLRMQAFQEFLADWYGESEAPKLSYSRSIVTDAGRIGFVLGNSAWRATGSPNDEDLGKLLVPLFDLESTLSEVGDCDIYVYAQHHPLEWLAPPNGGEVRDAIRREFDLFMFGHMHEPDPIQMTSPLGDLLSLQAPCLYGGSEYKAGYSIVDIAPMPDGVRINVHSREYFDRRREFDVDLSLGERGSQEFVIAVAAAGATSSVRGARERLQGLAIELTLSDEIPPDPRVEDLLVRPAFRRTTAEGDLAANQVGEEPSEREEAEALVAASDRVIVAAEPQAGLTGSLVWVANAHIIVTDRPILVVDCTDLGRRTAKSLKNKVNRSLKVQLGSPAPGTYDVVLDGLRSPSTRAIREVRKWAESFTGKIYLGTDKASTARFSDALSGADGKEVDVFFLASLNSSQVTDLVSIVVSDQDEQLLKGVMSTLATERLPRHPLIVGALARAAQSGHLTGVVINEPQLMQLYAESELERESFWETPTGLDYALRVRVLCLLAAASHGGESSELDTDHASAVLADYLNSVSSPLRVETVLDDIVERSLLLRDGGRIRFRLTAIRRLFLARAVIDGLHSVDDLDLKDLDGPHVLRYLAGLKRDSQEALSQLSEAVGDRDLKPLSELAQLTASAAAAMPNATEPPDVPTDFESPDPWDEEPMSDLEEAGSFLTLLTCLSSVVQNSDLVQDPAGKREATRRALGGWWTYFEVSTTSDFMEAIVAELPSVSDDDDRDKLQATIQAASFFGSLFGAAAWLPDERTEPLLQEVYDADGPDSPLGFLAGLLLISIGADEWPSLYASLYQAAGKLRHSSGDDNFFRRVVAGLANMDYYFRHDLDDDGLAELEGLLCNYYDGPMPSDAQGKQRRSQMLQRLRRERLKRQAGGGHHRDRSVIADPEGASGED